MAENAEMRHRARLEILQAQKTWLDETGRHGVGSNKAFTDAYNQGFIQVDEWVQKAYPGFSADALGGWWRRYYADGSDGVAFKYGHRKGSGILDNDEYLRQQIVTLKSQNPKMSARAMLRALKAVFPDRKLPSERTLSRFLGNC